MTAAAPERVAIVGSRDYSELKAVADYVYALPPDSIVISGGAVGVDSRAEAVAKARGLRVVSFRPNYELHGKRAPLVRNEAIAIDCDRMVAFWDGESRGTMHVVGIAQRLGKPVEIITEGGDKE